MSERNFNTQQKRFPEQIKIMRRHSANNNSTHLSESHIEEFPPEDLSDIDKLLGIKDNQLLKLDLNNKEIRENILAAFKEIHQALYSGDQDEEGGCGGKEAVTSIFHDTVALENQLDKYDDTEHANQLSEKRKNVRLTIIAFNELPWASDYNQDKGDRKDHFFKFLTRQYKANPNLTLRFMHEWVSLFWRRDFECPGLENSLYAWIKNISGLGPENHEYGKKLKDFIAHKGNEDSQPQKEEEEEEEHDDLDMPMYEKSLMMSPTSSAFDKRPTILGIKARSARTTKIREQAKILTFLVGEQFSLVHLGELTESNWKRKQKARLSPNVLQIIELNNSISAWTVENVLRAENLNDRTKKISMMIGIAEACYDHHDLCTSAAIIQGLMRHNVWQLKYAWKAVELMKWSSCMSMKQKLCGQIGSANKWCKDTHEMFLSQCLQDSLSPNTNVNKSKAKPYALPIFSWIVDQLYKLSNQQAFHNNAFILNKHKFEKINSIFEMICVFQQSWDKCKKGWCGEIYSLDEFEDITKALQRIQNKNVKDYDQEMDELSDKAKTSDQEEHHSQNGGLDCLVQIPQSWLLSIFAGMIFVDVIFRYYSMFFFVENGDAFWLYGMIFCILVSRLTQIGIVYMTKYSKTRPKWSIQNKLFDMALVAVGLGIPMSIYRWLFPQKESSSDAQHISQMRRESIPQDLSQTTTSCSLEFCRLRAAYQLECAGLAILHVYIIVDQKDFFTYQLICLPISFFIIAYSGYSITRSVTEPMFRFSQQENILAILMAGMFSSDFVLRISSIIFFFTAYDTETYLVYKTIVPFIVLMWEFSYVLYEYFTQLPKSQRRVYDIFLLLVQSFGLLASSIAAFLPLTRFRFVYFHIEFGIRFLISCAIMIITILSTPKDDNTLYRILTLCIAGPLCVITCSLVWHLSAEYRRVEEDERQKDLRAERERAATLKTEEINTTTMRVLEEMYYDS